jgi:hypothetical protein
MPTDPSDAPAPLIAAMQPEMLPVNRSLRWYLLIICCMPTMVAACGAGFIAIIQRLPWIARYQIDGDWIALGYFIALGLTTLALGYIHARIYDAAHPSTAPKRKGALLWHSIHFFIVQVFVLPLAITILAFFLAAIL